MKIKTKIENEKYNKNSKQFKNLNIVCWKCNQKGYIQSNCPKNNSHKENGMVASKKDKNKESEYEASFMAIEKLTKNLNLWTGNTGTSTHMKNTMEGLYNLREEETAIQIGNGKVSNQL
jgi:hypothetical protein